MDVVLIECKTDSGEVLFIPYESLAAWVSKGVQETRVFIKSAAGVNFVITESAAHFTDRIKKALQS